MKKITLACFFLLSILLRSQTLPEVKNAAQFIGMKFHDFEQKYKKSPIERESNFGIETKAYKFETYGIILEGDDNGNVDKISFVPQNYKNSNIVWYDNVKQIRADDNFKFVKSFINYDKTGFYSGDMKYIELIDKLREINDVEKIDVEIVFKKEGLYYSYLLVKNKLSIQISNKSTLE